MLLIQTITLALRSLMRFEESGSDIAHSDATNRSCGSDSEDADGRSCGKKYLVRAPTEKSCKDWMSGLHPFTRAVLPFLGAVLLVK